MAFDQHEAEKDANFEEAEIWPKLDLCAIPMNAGEGPNSYVQNSSYQRGVVDAAKPIIEEEVAMKLDIKQLISSSAMPNCFCIADFGCSTGHNSFPAVEIIIATVMQKLLGEKSSKINIRNLFVFFNDIGTNDFNTLFKSLPSKRQYHAIGVPGDFHGRLLPNNSLHFAYSSWSLHWLTEVPKSVADSMSPAWNKGAILYAKDNKKDVCEAYLEQYDKDIHAFLEARAQELVVGGIMALLIPAVPSFWDTNTSYTLPEDINLLGSCLIDMAKLVNFLKLNLAHTYMTII